MYDSLIEVEHDLEIGTYEINGLLCKVQRGVIKCASARILKGWARKLSRQFAKCTYHWQKDNGASGKVTYTEGRKTFETFQA